MAKRSQRKKKEKSDVDPERRRNSGGGNESWFKGETYLVKENWRHGSSRAQKAAPGTSAPCGHPGLSASEQLADFLLFYRILTIFPFSKLSFTMLIFT